MSVPPRACPEPGGYLGSRCVCFVPPPDAKMGSTLARRGGGRETAGDSAKPISQKLFGQG